MSLWIRQIRVHQWAKNLLLLLPAAAAHVITDGPVMIAVVHAFFAFSLVASALYIFNDVRDADHDRQHPTKKDRPIASGAIRPGVAMAVAVGLVAGGLLFARGLPTAFLWALGAYAGLTLAYSMGLKRLVLVDVLILATLFTLRVIAGAAAIDVSLSRWFLAFSVFVFLSLALVKRAVELRGLAGGPIGQREEDQAPGRGWRTSDLPILQGLGSGAAIAGALVYCLYITSEDVLVLYGRPDVLWAGLPLVLYVLGRTWIGVARDEVREDPVAHAMTDPGSWVAAILFGIVIVLAA